MKKSSDSRTENVSSCPAREEKTLREMPTGSFTEYDQYLFREGTDDSAYLKMGAHIGTEAGKAGTRFVLWAPRAKDAAIITSRTGWTEKPFPMLKTEGGIWELFLPEVTAGDSYRYVVTGADGAVRYKADPYAFFSELRPASASVIYPLDGYEWHDGEWENAKRAEDAAGKPMAIYEAHLGSWKKDPAKGPEGFLNYRELADSLSAYLLDMGYTHVELIGISEHLLDESWGYQVTGYYSPTSRHGKPDDFRYFVDTMHRCGIGVILDWVPAHFPKDECGLFRFDGTAQYEYEDPLRAEYPEWGTMAFDLGKTEVRSFLLSNAFYWVREFHIDALRVDAVAALLYNSFGRKKWRPNRFGGEENTESIAFLKSLNAALGEKTQSYLIAEDSSIMEGITRPVRDGGLGFGFKWNMGWMNDTLEYIGKDPVYRQYHHYNLTHSADYAFLEKFVLVLSHDEVVHLKHPMLQKFPGALQDQFGGLKTLYTYQMTHPGKKLLFMGQDFGDNREWAENREIDWQLLEEAGYRDVQSSVRDLLRLYREKSVLYTDVGDPRSFEWIRSDDYKRNILSYIRRNPWNYDGALLVICNFSPMPVPFECGAPTAGAYRRVFSTYDHLPGEGGPAELGGCPEITAVSSLCDGRPFRLSYSLRPYESVILEIPREDRD